jgi:hypothetical protein
MLRALRAPVMPETVLEDLALVYPLPAIADRHFALVATSIETSQRVAR